MEEAKINLSKLNAYRRNSEGNDYRSPEQLDSINSNVNGKADEMSIDFIDELNAKGIKNPDDLETKSKIVEEVLVSYRNKVIEWLKNS